MSLLDLARRLQIAAATEEERRRQEAAAEPDVALVLEVFPGARVVAFRQPYAWPPAGAVDARAWLAGSDPAIDPFAADPPTLPCPACRGGVWHRAGNGWTCRRCHPMPFAAPAVVSGRGAAEPPVQDRPGQHGK